MQSAELLLQGGYSLIRTGGTYVEADSDEVPGDGEANNPAWPPGLPNPGNTRTGFLWKKNRGPAWRRAGGQVYNHDGMAGVMTTRGWSLFEAIEMCGAMGITAVITLKSTETYQDLGDLVEYLYAGNGSEWGAVQLSKPGHGSRISPILWLPSNPVPCSCLGVGSCTRRPAAGLGRPPGTVQQLVV